MKARAPSQKQRKEKPKQTKRRRQWKQLPLKESKRPKRRRRRRKKGKLKLKPRRNQQSRLKPSLRKHPPFNNQRTHIILIRISIEELMKKKAKETKATTGGKKKGVNVDVAKKELEERAAKAKAKKVHEDL